MKAPAPLTDTDFGLMIEGLTKDEGRAPFIGFKCGDKYPALTAKFLSKDGKGFNQSLAGFPELFKLLNDIDAVAMYPGEDKISKTETIERMGTGGKSVPTGTQVVISRRKDGLISLRLVNSQIRDAIFPMRFGRRITTETRLESGEPIDMRYEYQREVLGYTEMIRQAGYRWKAAITERGNAEMKEKLQGSSNWGG